MLSLDELIQNHMAQLKAITGSTKRDQLSRSARRKELKGLLEWKVFIDPIMRIIKRHVEYVPKVNAANDTVMDKIERCLIFLNDSDIDYKKCEIMSVFVQLYIASFPIYVWKAWLEKCDPMSSRHYDIFTKFWSIFSQLLNTAARFGKHFLANMTNTERKAMVDSITDIPSFHRYINGLETPVAPIDVLLTILEYKGLSCRALNGLHARDLFIELYIPLSGSYTAMIKECDQSINKGAQTLKNWLIVNQHEESKMQPIICHALRYRRSEIYKPSYINPVTFCKGAKIPIIDFGTTKSNTNPFVAELSKPFKYNNHLVVAICIPNILCFSSTDVTMFSDVLAFEKMYCGKIAVVCSLGVILPPGFKSDILFMDIGTFKKHIQANP